MTRYQHQFAGAFILCLILSGCGETPAPEAAEIARPVKSFLIQAGSASEHHAFPARIGAGRRAALSFRIAGVLKQLPVKEGDLVEPGQLLAELDPTDLQIVYADHQARFETARRNFNRARDLIEQGNISQMDFDKLETEYKSAEAALKAARQNLDHTRLTAPFSGRIARRYSENFEEVQAKQPVLDLQDISELEVNFDVPENLLRGLKVKGEEQDKTSVTVSFTDIPGKRFPLTFREISTQADEKTQTFQVTYVMSRVESTNILPGMTATANVEIHRFNDKASLHTVPASAIVGDYKLDPQAWVIDEQSMTVKPRAVKVGRLSGESIEVLEGLQEGDRIVTAGTPFLVEGMPVRLMPEREQAVQRQDDLNYR
jgi:RND family efflux transporter MFP subunit